MACGPSNFQNGRRSDQLENGLRTGSENVFWNILISDSTSRAETSFFRTNFSRRIPWCVWEPLKTLLLKKLMNSQNANGPQKKTLQNHGICSEKASENLFRAFETWIRLQIFIRMQWRWSQTPKTSKIIVLGRKMTKNLKKKLDCMLIRKWRSV